MTHADGSAAQSTMTAGGPTRRRRRIAFWLAIVSLVIAAMLFPLLPGFPSPLFLPVLVVGAAAGVVALVLSVRARRPDAGPRGLAGALTLAIVALVIDAVLIGCLVIGLMTRPQLAQVEVQATGGPTFTVTYADDFQTYTDEEWHTSGFKRFTTKSSSTEITVTAAKGTSAPVGCKILWNGAVVADETSTGGTVTCSYDAK